MKLVFFDGPGGTGKTSALENISKIVPNSAKIDCDYRTLISRVPHLSLKHVIKSRELTYTLEAVKLLITEIKTILKRDPSIEYIFCDRSFISNVIYLFIACERESLKPSTNLDFTLDVVNVWTCVFELLDEYLGLIKDQTIVWKEFIFLNESIVDVAAGVVERGNLKNATMIEDNSLSEQFEFSSMEFKYFKRLVEEIGHKVCNFSIYNKDFDVVENCDLRNTKRLYAYVSDYVESKDFESHLTDVDCRRFCIFLK